MMMLPTPGVLDVMVRDRQKKLRMKRHQGVAGRSRTGVRVRIGHALIAVGSSLSGERLERPARRSVVQPCA
jgi:hypothetical protein